ncbi:MAG: hypothetical protein WC984_09290 [Bacteroidales bacterium]
MEYKYKYFDTIDEEYIQSQKFPSFPEDEDSERIKNAKEEKYKNIDLRSLYKIHSEPAVLDYIYMEIVSRLGFKDPILLYKWHVENYDHGIGIKTPDQVKQFYKELSCILDKDNISYLIDFNQYVDNEFQKVINNTDNIITNDKYNYELMTDKLNTYIPTNIGISNLKQEPIDKKENNVDANLIREPRINIGNLDYERSKELYKLSIKYVFELCTYKDFANSLNNPNEYNLVVKNKTALFMLYANLENFFDVEEIDNIVDSFNKKNDISQSYYKKRRFNSQASYLSTTQRIKNYNSDLNNI